MDLAHAFSSRAGRRLGSAVLATALAAVGAPAGAQVVVVPAALLSHAEGSVALAPRGDNEWADVRPRRALKRGDRVWTDRGSRAELQAGPHLLRMDSQSQVTLESVGEAGTQVSLLRGSVALSVAKLGAAENLEVGTPNLAFRARQPGDYRIDVDTQQGTTRVSVMSGAAVVYGEQGEAVDVGAGQRLTFRERSLAKAPTAAFAAVDDFDRWTVARGRAPAMQPQVTPAVHPDAIARMHREQEAQRIAQAKRELEEQRQALARERQQRQQPQVAQAAPPARAVEPPRPVEPAPRIVQVPRTPDEGRAAAKRTEEERQAAQARRVEAERRASLARKAEQEQQRVLQARRAHEERRLAARRAEDERRQAALGKREQERRLAAARKAEHDKRLVLAKKAGQDRRLAQAKREQQHADAASEARKAQLARLQEQAHREEQATREQRARREEQMRREEHARREEESRREEQARREDETRREAWERRQRALAEQQKRDHEVWLRAQQPVQPVRPPPQGVPARRVM